MMFRRVEWLQSIFGNHSGVGRPDRRRRSYTSRTAHEASSPETLEDRILLTGNLTIGLQVPASAAAGDTIAVNVTLTNTGSTPQNGSVADLDVPTAAIQSITGNDITCFPVGQNTLCLAGLGDLAPGQSKTATFMVTLKDDLPDGTNVLFTGLGSTDQCFDPNLAQQQTVRIGAPPAAGFMISDPDGVQVAEDGSTDTLFRVRKQSKLRFWTLFRPLSTFQPLEVISRPALRVSMSSCGTLMEMKSAGLRHIPGSLSPSRVTTGTTR